MKNIHEWRLSEMMSPSQVGNEGDIDWNALKRAMGQVMLRVDTGLFNKMESRIGPLIENWIEDARRENPAIGEDGILVLRKKILQNLLAVAVKLTLGEMGGTGRNADLNRIAHMDRQAAAPTPPTGPSV